MPSSPCNIVQHKLLYLTSLYGNNYPVCCYSTVYLPEFVPSVNEECLYVPYHTSTIIKKLNMTQDIMRLFNIMKSNIIKTYLPETQVP